MNGTRITAGGFWTVVSAGEPSGPTGTDPAQHAEPSLQREDPTRWIIIRGEYDDAMNIGVFTGTEDEIRALIAELNEFRKYVNPYDPEQVEELRGSEYRYEESTSIRSATAVIGATPSTPPGTGTQSVPAAMDPAKLTRVLDLLEALVDHDPCHLDHHNSCQTHNFYLDPGEQCPVAEALAVLAGLGRGERADA